MANQQPHRVKSISEFHEFRDLPKPEHPLVSVYNFEDLKYLNKEEPKSLILDFYSIALKRNANAKMRYGQQEYDFKEGVLLFIAPGQVFSIEGNSELQHTGHSLLIHPDFLWNTPLAQKIKQYEYFGYAVHEALHLSDKEEKMIIDIMKNIQQEYRSNIDKFSQDVIIAQIELLLTYSERFYNRQFITRKINNHEILARLEKLLEEYFNNDSIIKKGIPTVQYIAENLNVSPNYLSGLLKHLTGQSTQQHIHNKLIEKAKEKLSTTNLSVSEIAFELGFEHQQSFSKLFKTKTNVSPLEFRQSFN
ncbi:helix-turn-helix domain-containing protein [Flavobacterium johnsoniae]|uniref:Transcriptional regulator, AraC family n=1 Tax=Flavobacterium johnsoniae (strain ATCC 17061 / DSM 2064 / JCM 8514 / BCRC 14874 / CCUG 350202 / NBRC 14942 / NCIMB 11054 / UW101) TaxID=376686 RepID=A5FAS3_FLAJ1|nr:helix-turn-helix transcriptional regulator [Flavobacterium johnsoniae]ABQ07691.1 transcriptional regulator, AraC family [Flavobacterium johnsoniae UW101]OXG01775.1 AraC family transcriptional regulator [Flavobacterium johnsoniae UW101]WQG80470.1 helix-turn-helix transcriptional regulator [Flavobacterium johnsoniae UW101]SHL05245.1 transcriptional regulator, AraC family [Flavobacterium johnsoniae]